MEHLQFWVVKIPTVVQIEFEVEFTTSYSAPHSFQTVEKDLDNMTQSDQGQYAQLGIISVFSTILSKQ